MMRKTLFVGSFIGLSMIPFILSKLGKHITIEKIERIEPNSDIGDEEFTEQEEAEQMIGRTAVNMHSIHFGDLSIPCPVCDLEIDNILIGMGTLEDDQSEDGPVNELYPIGIIYFACGHYAHSMCLVDKVARLLNAEEIGQLRPEMFDKLMECSVHGGENERP